MMKEFRDEDGNITVVATGIENDVQPAALAYLRPSRHANRFPAEICVKHGDDYFAVAMNRDQLMNMLETGTRLLREFDKRPIEDLEVE